MQLTTMASTAVAMTAFLAACGPPGADSSGGAVPDCGACVSEMAAVGRQAERVPGVKATLETRFAPRSPTSSNEAFVYVDVKPDAPTDVADRVAELVWRSEIQPLDSITVLVSEGSAHDYTSYEVGPEDADYASYVEEWGERPVG